MKSTDGPDDPWAGVADPVPGARSGADTGPRADGAPDEGPGEGPEERPDDRREDSDEDSDDAGHEAGADDVRPDPAERLAEEARRLAEAVAAQLGGVREEVREKVVDPLIRRHPEAAAHLGAAGAELLAAYRAFVADKERRWASRSAPAQRVDLDLDPDDAGDDRPDGGPRD